MTARSLRVPSRILRDIRSSASRPKLPDRPPIYIFDPHDPKLPKQRSDYGPTKSGKKRVRARWSVDQYDLRGGASWVKVRKTHPWYVIDGKHEGGPAPETKQDGYRTREEAVRVAKEQQAKHGSYYRTDW